MADPVLWLDSNVARSVPKVRTLVELARRKGVKIVVHAQVHLEICRQQRERSGDAFSQELIRSFLEQLDIDVVDATLDRRTVEIWAELLHQRYPSGDMWKSAKLSAVKARLPEAAQVHADRVPMTTDWLIALEVEHRGSFVAVEDKGEEWSALRSMSPKRALSYEETLRWLEARTDVEA